MPIRSSVKPPVVSLGLKGGERITLITPDGTIITTAPDSISEVVRQQQEELLAAHHDDDLAETVLTELTKT